MNNKITNNIIMEEYILGEKSINDKDVIKRKNVYIGRDSVLKIIFIGDDEKVNKEIEVLFTFYALVCDWITGNYCLSHYETIDYIPLVLPKTKMRLIGRINVIYDLLKRAEYKILGKHFKLILYKYIDAISNYLLNEDYGNTYLLLKELANITNTNTYLEKILNGIINKKRFVYLLWKEE